MSISAHPKDYANWPREKQDAYYRANVVVEDGTFERSFGSPVN
jgi:hypothetical protein